MDILSASNRTGLTFTFVVIVALFLILGLVRYIIRINHGPGMMGGVMMMSDGTTGQTGMHGYGWLWFPTAITAGVGIFLGWLLHSKKK
jgi:hypothetical protein